MGSYRSSVNFESIADERRSRMSREERGFMIFLGKWGFIPNIPFLRRVEEFGIKYLGFDYKGFNSRKRTTEQAYEAILNSGILENPSEENVVKALKEMEEKWIFPGRYYLSTETKGDKKYFQWISDTK